MVKDAKTLSQPERWRRKQHAHANRSKIDKAFFTRIASLRRSGSPLEGHLGVPWEANNAYRKSTRSGIDIGYDLVWRCFARRG
jgi:hypothetical protein